MEYYVVLNRERKGPFTIDQLKTMGLTPNTMVWHKGLSNWVKAMEVAELSALISQLNEPPMVPPPPYVEESKPQMGAVPPVYQHEPPRKQYNAVPPQYDNEKKASSSALIIAIVAIVVVAIIVAIFMFPNVLDIFKGNDDNQSHDGLATIENPIWSADVSESQKIVITELLNDMVKVPAGAFAMGTKRSACTVGDFYIGKYEITQSQWEAVMGTTISQQRAIHSGDRLTGVGSDLPMYYVNQSEAKNFCNELSRKTGLSFNLPTEAQWEYAAKGAGTEYYRYCGSENINDVAWYGENYAYGSVHPVGRLLPNSLGLHDMSGNVWEWCRETAKIRGGCILHDESKCKVTWSWSEPNYYKGFNRGGFRIVME